MTGRSGNGAGLISPSGESRSAATDPGKAGAAAGTGVVGEWERLNAGGEKGLARYLAQAGLAGRASAADMPRLLALMADSGDPAMRALLLRRWVELDPAGAGKWVLSPGNDQGQEMELVFSAWAKKDPAAAMDGLRANSRTGRAFFTANKVLNRLLEEDLEAGVKFGALTGPSRGLDNVGYSVKPNGWVEKDPAKAAALLSALPPGEFRDVSLSQALNALAKTDFAAALALFEKFPNPGSRIRLGSTRGDFYKEWARRDLPAVTAFLNEKADPNERSSIKSAMVAAMGATDPLGTLAWAQENLRGGAQSGAALDILKKLSREDPAAALSYLDTLPAGGTLNGAVDAFVQTLPEGDAAAILAKAESLPEGALRTSLTAKAYEKMYAQDPAALLKNLASQPAASLPPGIWTELGGKTSSLEDGMKHLAAIPPDAAPEFISALFKEQIDSGQGDLEKFTSALSDLTVPEQRAAAMEGAMRLLVFFTRAKVSDWAKTLPDDERHFVAGLMEKNIVNLTPNQRKALIDPLRR